VQKELLKLKIKEEAKRLGFDFCGVSKAEFLEEEAPRLEQWLKQGMHGKMAYMENYFDKRLDPRKLMPGAKTVISLLQNYYTKEKQPEEAPKISMYAYGNDYHFVIKKKLKALLEFIRGIAGDVNGKAFVDSAPVLDRVWAKRSGLGWIGKNSQLINPKAGSYYFIAELITDLELPPDFEIKDFCGTCNKCMEACPTRAIVKPYVVDGSKCISYFTIELKEEIPSEFKGKTDNWAFGCDVCQQVCPWNRFSKPHDEPGLMPNQELMKMDKKDWQEMQEDVFNKIFARSPLKRAKWEGMKRNLEFIGIFNPKSKQ
jgi:epoxyqueuosine reductase